MLYIFYLHYSVVFLSINFKNIGKPAVIDHCIVASGLEATEKFKLLLPKAGWL